MFLPDLKLRLFSCALAVGLALVAVGFTQIAIASGDDVLDDCSLDEQLSRVYSQREYREALDTMVADMRQYTSCEAVIRDAQVAAAAVRGSGRSQETSSGAPQLDSAAPATRAAEILVGATPDQRRALERAKGDAPSPVVIDGAPPLSLVGPGALASTSRLRGLPPSLQVMVLLLIGGGTIWGLTAIVRSTRRRRLLRISR